MADTSKSKRLFELFTEDAKKWVFSAESTSGGEVQFTGEHVYPRLRSFVDSLRHRSLIVRADRNRPPGSLRLHGLTFVPDVEVVEFADKHLAIEVKFLRDTDPSGSLAKAIGQGILYKSLGFSYSHVFVVDCRSNAKELWSVGSPMSGVLPSGLSLSVYSEDQPKRIALVASF